MRGLKQIMQILIGQTGFVASFTDAWIETLATLKQSKYRLVASFTDAWIETYKTSAVLEKSMKPSHLLQMRGLKPI